MKKNLAEMILSKPVLSELALPEMTLAHIQALPQEFLGPCQAVSIPPRNGCQSLTVIEAETATPGTQATTPAGEGVVGMRRESGPACKKLYKRYCAVWVN
jgi:hypothetical protein